MKAVHEETFIIRANEVGMSGVTRTDSIAALLQETAGNHANELNFDIKDLQNDNITWVLHQLHMKMNRYPAWRDTITIKTWPSSGDGLRAYRDFRILDSEGNELGVALSYWLIMNVKTRKPVRIPQQILDLGLQAESHVLPVTRNRYDWDIGTDDSYTTTVARTDVDLNRHANNVAFIRWMLESVDEDTYFLGQCRELNIQFISEARLGDQIKVYTTTGNSERELLHSVTGTSRALSHGFSVWTI